MYLCALAIDKGTEKKAKTNPHAHFLFGGIPVRFIDLLRVNGLIIFVRLTLKSQIW